jgi:hypothetical protein
MYAFSRGRTPKNSAARHHKIKLDFYCDVAYRFGVIPLKKVQNVKNVGFVTTVSFDPNHYPFFLFNIEGYGEFFSGITPFRQKTRNLFLMVPHSNLLGTVTTDPV